MKPAHDEPDQSGEAATARPPKQNDPASAKDQSSTPKRKASGSASPAAAEGKRPASATGAKAQRSKAFAGISAVAETVAVCYITILAWAMLFVAGYFITEVTQTLEDISALSQHLIVSLGGLRPGALLDEGRFLGPMIDIRWHIALYLGTGIAILLAVRSFLDRGHLLGLRRWLRGGAVVALAAGMFNATLSYGPAVERSVVPELAVGISWTGAEEEQWRNISMYLPPTVLVRGDDELPLLIMGVNASSQHRGPMPSFTIWIDGIEESVKDPTSWARPLGGSCESQSGRADGSEPLPRRDGSFAVPRNAFTCRIAPDDERQTDGLLTFLPDGYMPVVIELASPILGFHGIGRGEGVRFHAVGIDAYGGAGNDEFDRHGQRLISALPVADDEDSSSGVRSTYVQGIAGSEAQNISGFANSVALGVAYDFEWDDAYVSEVRSGTALSTSGLLMFYGESQPSTGWLASWTERRRSRDSGQQVADAVSIALLGGFVAFFVGATPLNRRSRLTAAGGAVASLAQRGRTPKA